MATKSKTEPNELAKKLLAALDNAITFPTVNAIGERTLRAILAAQSVTSIVTPEEKDALAGLQAHWEKIQSAMIECDLRAGKRQYFEQQAALAADPLGYDAPLLSREALDVANAERRAALKAAKRQNADAAHQIALRVWERIGKICGEFATRREQAEREDSEQFGVAFVPSSILISAKNVARDWVKFADALKNSSPANQCGQLLSLETTAQ